MTLEPLDLQLQRALKLPPESVVVRSIGVARRPLITLIDPGFESQNELERQRGVRQRLRDAGIDPNELGFIMTNTPEEDAALREDVLDDPEGGSVEDL